MKIKQLKIVLSASILLFLLNTSAANTGEAINALKHPITNRIVNKMLDDVDDEVIKYQIYCNDNKILDNFHLERKKEAFYYATSRLVETVYEIISDQRNKLPKDLRSNNYHIGTSTRGGLLYCLANIKDGLFDDSNYYNSTGTYNSILGVYKCLNEIKVTAKKYGVNEKEFSGAYEFQKILLNYYENADKLLPQSYGK